MITTSVKDLSGGVMNLGASAQVKPQDKQGNDSFQKVFDKQTSPKEDGKAVKAGKDHRESLKKQNADRAGRIRDNSDKETDVEDPAKNEELLEKVAEEVGEITQQLSEKMTELLAVSPEELENTIEQLGMEPADLLDGAKLNDLIMAAEGVEDSLELLTNGELYDKVQELLGFQKELVESAAQDLHLQPGQLAELAKGPLEETVTEPEELLTGLSLETTVQESKSLQTAENDRQEGKAEISQTDVSLQDPVAQAQKTQQENAQQPGGQSGRREHDSKENQGSGNLVLDQMLQRAAEPAQAFPMEEIAPAERADTEMIMRQILDHMKAQIKPDVSSLEMQLHPASLGNLQVQLTSRGGAVTAQFLAQNETVKAALETQMIQLRESFEEQGIKVEAIEVSVQTQSFERNLEEQGRGRQEQQTPRSRGTRRIRIDESLTPEALDELTQDDRLAAEMLQAGGGTVDFTA